MTLRGWLLGNISPLLSALPFVGGLLRAAVGGGGPAATRETGVIDVMDYGADPSGNPASDNSVAFNNANAVAAATGKDLLIPAGIYHVKNTTTIGSNTNAVRCFGTGQSIIDVDSDFSPSATAVFVLQNPMDYTKVLPGAGSSLDQLQFRFHWPAEVRTTATLAAAPGATTITVASAAGIIPGMYVCDETLANAAALGNPLQGGPIFTVSSIAGNVITLSHAVIAPGVANGDSIGFAQARAQWQPLGTGTTTPGGTGIRYPWAIYAAAATSNESRLTNITVMGAYNGIYLHGNAPFIDNLVIGAMNVGLDMDECHDFGYVGSYKFGGGGLGDSGNAGVHGWASTHAFYDGTPIAINLGAQDGTYFDCINSWTGQMVCTANFSWCEFGSINLDGTHAWFTMASTNGTGFAQVGSFYKTSGGEPQVAFYFVPAAGFRMKIDNFYMVSSSSVQPSVYVNNGELTLSGYQWSGNVNATGGIQLLGGSLRLIDMALEAGGGQPNGFIYVNQTGGVLYANGVRFISNGAGFSGVGIKVVDTALNVVRNVDWNGWVSSGIPATGALGFYDGYTPVPLSGTTITSSTGNLTIGTNAAAAASIYMNASGSTRMTTFQTAGVTDWTSGENASKAWFVTRYVSGAYTDDPIVISNSTGAITQNKTAMIDHVSTGLNDLLTLQQPNLGAGQYGVFRIGRDATTTFASGYAAFVPNATAAQSFMALGVRGTANDQIVLRGDNIVLLPTLQASASYASDAAAATGGVPVGGLYRNGSVVQIRVV